MHLELLDSMGTHTLILAIIRFTNIYGIPGTFYSDNARSFILGCDLLSEVFASNEYLAKFQMYNIKHIRIPLYSAWVGSTWERLIRIIKSCLYKTVRKGHLEYFELLTVISDIQKVVNLRPLTYRCADEDLLELITPNCFIQPLSAERLLTKSNDKLESTTHTDILKTIEAREKLVNQFRDLWYNDYLISLREHCKDLYDINYSNKINVGDVVLVKSPAKTRPCWDLGRVMELIPGDDGKVRSVKLKRGDKTISTHSVKLLYPIELSLTHNHNTSINSDVLDNDDSPADVNESSHNVLSNLDSETPLDIQSEVVTAGSRPKKINAGKRFANPKDPYMYY